MEMILLYKKVIMIALILMSFTLVGWTSWEEGYIQEIKSGEVIFENTNKYTYIKTQDINDKVYMNNVIVIYKEKGEWVNNYLTVLKDNNIYKFKISYTLFNALLNGDKINICYSLNENKILEICKYK